MPNGLHRFFLDLLLFGYSVVYIFVGGGGGDLFSVLIFGVVFYFFSLLGEGFIVILVFCLFQRELKVG